MKSKFWYLTKQNDASLITVPFEVNGRAGQGEGRCSGGETHHSASGNALQREVVKFMRRLN